MAIIELRELKHYIGCNQYDKFIYNIISNEINNIDDIVLMLSVTENEFLDNYFYYNYIPLPSLNILDAFNHFIISLNNKKVLDHFKDMDKKDILNYWLEFDSVFYVGTEHRLWNEYYDNYIEKKAVDWCSEYGIRYR